MPGCVSCIIKLSVNNILLSIVADQESYQSFVSRTNVRNNCPYLHPIHSRKITDKRLNSMEDDKGLQAVADSTDKFANNYFKVLVKNNPGNLITSPLSVQIVLAMAAYGAAGKTGIGMRSALKLPRNNKLGQSGFQSLIETVNNEKEVELRLATKIYTATSFEVKSKFREMTADNFLSSTEELDFNDPVKAAQTMNDWCEEQSNKRLTNIVSPGDLPSDTLLVLVNAVYFKGKWEKPFQQHFTKNRVFHVDENTKKRVPTMHTQRVFRYGDLEKLDARFVEIPYEGERLSMIIILPNDINGLEKVQNNLDKVNLKKRLQSADRVCVELYLPKFKIKNDLNLNPILEKLGMAKAFQAGANFSGIADVPLNITTVLQTAFIEVDEKGTEAFAYTRLCGGGGPLVPPPPPPEFKVNRPFYYAIYHVDTGISLFTGVVHHPIYK